MAVVATTMMLAYLSEELCSIAILGVQARVTELFQLQQLQ